MNECYDCKHFGEDFYQHPFHWLLCSKFNRVVLSNYAERCKYFRLEIGDEREKEEYIQPESI